MITAFPSTKVTVLLSLTLLPKIGFKFSQIFTLYNFLLFLMSGTFRSAQHFFLAFLSKVTHRFLCIFYLSLDLCVNSFKYFELNFNLCLMALLIS